MFMDLIDELCAEKKITVSKLSTMLGVTRSNICHWRARNTIPSGEMLSKIADIFGVSVDYLLERTAQPSDSLVEYEVIGKISAGYDGEAVEIKTGETIQLSKDMLCGRTQEEFFILEIKGNSMFPRFLPNDKIMCLKTNSVDSGSTAVVMYNSSEATVKVVKFGEGSEQYMDLIPVNPEYETKHITGEDLNQCRVLGKVVKLIRDVI